MRISDWSSDVCSSDLAVGVELAGSPRVFQRARLEGQPDRVERDELGAAERGGLVDLDHDVALSREPDLADQSPDDGADLRRVEQDQRERLGTDLEGHRDYQAAAAARLASMRASISSRASFEISARVSIPSSLKPASSRKRRARRTGLSSSSPRKPPGEKSLSTTRWHSRARFWRSL